MPHQLPLTFQQQWLWDLLKRHDGWNCTVAYGLRLKGTLNIALLHRSVEEVVRRHGSLRTNIVAVDGVAWQQIDTSCRCRLEQVQVAGDSAAEIEDNARKLFEELCDLRFDLTVGPLLKIKLLSLSKREYWLVLAVHRLIADCVSGEQVLQELWLLYGKLRRGAALPAAPAQYGDYALGQRRGYREWAVKHEDYWDRRLTGARRIRWPADAHGTLAAPGTLGKMSCLFGEVLSRDLRELARRSRSLTATAMLAVYIAVLWRWCRQDDFVVPFNIAGRQSEHHSVVGYFSHILYLRVEMTGNETFSELLSRVGNEFYRALSHQDFGRMATREPELLAGTFFQWITWHPHDVSGLEVPDTREPIELTAERLSVRDFGEGLTAIPPGVVDVEVSLFDTKDGIHAFGVYRTDLFTGATMERFMAQLRSASEQFVRNPHATIVAADLTF